LKSRRIFVPPEGFSSDGINFSRAAVGYMKKVLRLKPGDQVIVFDGACEYLARLVRFQNGLRGEVIELQGSAPMMPKITLAFGCVRPGPLNEILRHGTELGVSKFVPLISLRTSRRPEERKQRWQAVVSSAAAQSGRIQVPEVEAPVSLRELLTRDHACERGFILSATAGVQPLIAALGSETMRSVILLVGPEGGFDPSEEEAARRAGFSAVSLGFRVLRTETAAIGALAVIVSWLDQTGSKPNDASADVMAGAEANVSKSPENGTENASIDFKSES